MTWRGIDVSEHNGVLNWQQIKDSGIQFAVIRSSWGHFNEDKMVRRNVAECERIGLPYGLYHYSYAATTQQMQQEAAGLVSLMKQFRPLYPVYIDMEDADGWKQQQGIINNTSFLAEVCRYTCEAIQNAGYYAGIYSNLYWFTTKLNTSVLDPYDKWLAQWASEPTYDKPFGMWQYSSDGSVPGSSARTDMDIAYKDYPAIIKEKGLNHSDSSAPDPAPNPEPAPQPTYKVGDQVSFHTIYTSSDSTAPLTPSITSGTITQIIPGARNPYLINNGTGWINDASINTESGGTVTGYKTGDIVTYRAIYSSSDATQALKPAITSGTITKVIPAARNPYLINNGTGWVNNDVITGSSSNQVSDQIKVGSYVRVKSGAKDYNGGSLADFVYQTTYQVLELQGDRAVIGLNNQVTAAVALSNLYLV